MIIPSDLRFRDLGGKGDSFVVVLGSWGVWEA